VEIVMTYRGHVKNGQITLDVATALPEGAEVAVEVVKDGNGNPTIWKKLLEVAGAVDDLPTDMAKNHDHYIHGTPKK
jgi:hypothetical protein